MSSLNSSPRSLEKDIRGGLKDSEDIPVSSRDSERSVFDSEATGASPMALKYDEGARAWRTVAGGWLVMFCVLGLPLSFGVMESFYVERYLASSTPSRINWIGSLQLGFQCLVGVLVAGLFDAGHFRWLSMSGSVLFVFSLFMLSLAKEEKYYQVFLSQGLGLGIAIGLMFTPTSSAVSQHFQKRRGFAMGIITTGSALGGTFFSIILGHFLNGPIGFAWGVRICAFICLACLALANILMKTNYPHPALKPAVDTDTDTDTPPVGNGMPLRRFVRTTSYIAFITFGFVASVGLYNPMFSVELFALRKAHISQTLGGYLLAILNTSSIFGRLFFNRLADRYGVFEVYVPCMTAAGIIASVMTRCTNLPSIVMFCILYGMFSGSAVSLYFPAVLSLDRDVTRSGLRLGLASVPVGLASLVGTPIAAAVVGHDRWWAGSVFTGVLELSSAILLLISFLTRPNGRQ